MFQVQSELVKSCWMIFFHGWLKKLKKESEVCEIYKLVGQGSLYESLLLFHYKKTTPYDCVPHSSSSSIICMCLGLQETKNIPTILNFTHLQITMTQQATTSSETTTLPHPTRSVSPTIPRIKGHDAHDSWRCYWNIKWPYPIISNLRLQLKKEWNLHRNKATVPVPK